MKLAIFSAFPFSTVYKCNQVAIYSDNTNAVNMFGSLHAKPVYNSILMAAINFSISSAITTKVYYVPGWQNVIADYLSQFLNARALQLAPNLTIHNFQPPSNVLGAIKKWISPFCPGSRFGSLGRWIVCSMSDPYFLVWLLITWGSGPLLCMAGYSSLCELFFIMSNFILTELIL